MIKRFVILQDEQLVSASSPSRGLSGPVSMTPTGRRGPSRPGASGAAAVPVAARLPFRRTLTDEDEEEDEDEGDSAATEGRRLVDVAREAALNAERTIIADTLKQVHWNRRKAAQLLGVSYKTLLNKIKETGLERT